PSTIDHFCKQLWANGTTLPVVYFCEWVDRWLMGNLVPGPGCMNGTRYQVTCLRPEQATEWAEQCGDQFPEQGWLASRLREAAAGWALMTDRRVVVAIREVIGPSTTDDEVRESLGRIPGWLSAWQEHA